MTVYSLHGKGHRMLSRAEHEAVSAAELIFAAVGDAPRNKRSKGWRAFDRIKRDGLLELRDGLYWITPEGRDALTCLRSGHDAVIATPAPSVRVFVDRRAA